MWPFKRTIFKNQKVINDIVPPVPEVEYTPDFMWLERHKWCLLFVYDEPSAYMISKHYGEAKFRGKAFTENSEWTLWKKKLGTETFPIALKGAGIGIPRRIKGMIFAIRPQIFWNTLDLFHSNTVEFQRERVRILRPRTRTSDGERFIDKLTCHMYVGKPDYWLSQIDNGYQYATVKSFSPKVTWADGHTFGSYYSYTRLEDETNF